MDVSIIHGRSHSRLVNGRQGNSGTRNGSTRFHANHAVIMKEVRCILQVLRQGIDVQRLIKDVGKLQANEMVQGTVHLRQVSQRDRVRRLNRLGQLLGRAGGSSFGCLSGTNSSSDSRSRKWGGPPTILSAFTNAYASHALLVFSSC
jgi:hypothetical protein